MKVRLNSERSINRHAARTDEVEAVLGDIAFEILGRARARLEQHRKTGTHKVTQTKGVVDHYINLEGPAAVAIENGHHDPRTGEWVEGLGILDGAL